MLHANFTALSSIEPELLPIEVYIAEMGIFAIFAPSSCDLDLDPMCFIYELDPYSLEMYRMTDKMLSYRRETSLHGAL